jgi:small subunit ribosomal protein S21
MAIRVNVINNNVELALKKMKQKIKDSGMLVELKERSYFKKPSEIKRRKKNLAKSRQKYKQIKENNRHY